VAELLVPEIVEDPFREHYRSLVMGSLLRAAEAQTERHRLRGHKLRARRAERVAQRLQPVREPLPVPERAPVPEPQIVVPGPVVPVPVPPEPVAAPPRIVAPPPVEETVPTVPAADYEPWFGANIRRAAAVVWFATLAALIANVIVLGLDSPATIAADLGLVAMTFVWFAASIDDLIGPGR
jgi:hypothetical protein